MNVLLSIPSIDPSFGGPVAGLKGLCAGLIRTGARVAILTSSTGDTSRDHTNALAFPDIEIIWIKLLVLRYFWTPFLGFKIRQKLREFDICHVHGLFNGISRAVCKAAQSLGIPYVLEPYGTLSPYCLTKSRFIKGLSLAFGERRNIEQAAGVKFTSDGEYQRFKRNFETHNGFIAANGLDWSEFNVLPERGEFRKEFAVDENELIFLFLGRLQPIKGLEVFIPAFLHWIKSKNAKIRLAIAGPDESGYRGILQKLVIDGQASNSIFFTGPLYGQDRLRALVDSDVVVLPSFHENFGIAAAEGMACGRPVFVSDQVDIWPDVKRLDLGEVASMNHESMVAALNTLSLRKQEWPEIGRRGKAWVQENCDWDLISFNILSKYREIIDSRTCVK